MADREFDAIVIGGGPAGASAAIAMARGGLSVAVLERSPHPRFHIGESFLPRNRTALQEMGLWDKFQALTHVEKFGAEFVIGNDPSSARDFRFDQGFDVGETVTWNIERAPYDAMLLNAAREAGAEVIEGPSAKRAPVLEDGRVELETDAGLFKATCLIDASGQGTFLGRQLGTRRVLDHHQKVAYFGHFTNVHRHEGFRAGYPTVAMCAEGWFWMIPIDPVRTSIGMVMDAASVKRVGVAPNQMLAWGIENCPVLRERTKNAVFPAQNGVCADFSYRCEPYAGPGYYLVGDAAMFVDPIFSTGACLGLLGGKLAGESVVRTIREGADPVRLRREYIRYLRSSSRYFFRLIDLYYRHSFRELFLHGTGPLEVHRAVISLLAGHVFPSPPMKLVWRMKLFEVCVWLNQFVPLVPRRRDFSLLEAHLARAPAMA